MVAAFIPGTDQFLNSDALLCLARQYEINIDDLSVKLQQIRRMIQRKEAEGNTSYSHIQPLSWSTMTVRPTTRSADFCVLHGNCMQWRSEHITPLLRKLDWLRVPERIKFRLCILAFRCLRGTVPRYLAETLHLTTSHSSRSRLCSADTSTLIVPATRRRTLGDRAFPAAAARAWNSLLSFVRDKQSLATFRRQLKTVLFRTSFGEDANTWAASLSTRDSFSVC